jgi:hypothetical protein
VRDGRPAAVGSQVVNDIHSVLNETEVAEVVVGRSADDVREAIARASAAGVRPEAERGVITAA